MSHSLLDQSLSNKIEEVDHRLQEDSIGISQEETHPLSNVNPQLHLTSDLNHSNSILQQNINTSMTESFEAKESKIKANQEQAFENPQNNNIRQSYVSVPSQTIIDPVEQMNVYFENRSSEFSKKNESQTNMIDQTNQKIYNQLVKGQSSISSKQKNLQFTRKELPLKSEESMIKELEMQKMETIKKLRDIQMEQVNTLKIYLRSHSTKIVPLEKSVFTLEERKKVASILKRKQLYEDSLNKKNQEFYEKIVEAKKERDEHEKREIESCNLKKQEQLSKKLDEIKARSQFRKEALKNSMIREKHRYVHVENQKLFNKSQEQKQKEAEAKLKLLKENHKLSMKEIHEHEQQYVKSLVKRAQSPKQRTISQTLPKRQPTFFSKLVEEEMFEIKEKNFEKIMKVREHEFQNKIQKYQQKVHLQFMPSIDPNKSVVLNEPIDYSSLSLSKEKRVEKGLQYLQKAKSLKKSMSTPNGLQVRVKEAKLYGYSQYKDYTKEHKRIKYNPTKRSFKELLDNKEELQNYESLIKAKYLAETIQSKSKKNQDKKIYESVRNKLSLLSNLY